METGPIKIGPKQPRTRQICNHEIKLTKSRHVQLSNIKVVQQKHNAEADKNLVQNANWRRGK